MRYCQRGTTLAPAQSGQTSLSNAWNLKAGSQMEVKGHQIARVGYGTCGLSVNMPSARPAPPAGMYARTTLRVRTHIHVHTHTHTCTVSDFIWLRRKQRQDSFGRWNRFDHCNLNHLGLNLYSSEVSEVTL